MKYSLDVNLDAGISHIRIENGMFETLGSLLREYYPGKKIMVISDENVYTIYGPTLEQQIRQSGSKRTLLILPFGEGCKTPESLMEIYKALLFHQFTRDDVIIAFGGGSIGDVAGFAAASYLRGISLVQIPTTLTSQADNMMGGKNGINLPEGKNLIGTFYHPNYVFIDPTFTRTLEPLFQSSGMAEIIKYAAIADMEFFEHLLSLGQREDQDTLAAIIHRCCEIKKRFIEEYQYDDERLMMLNFGHTLGHGIELYYGYTRPNHGEAVAIGMHAITRRSEQLGLTSINTSAMLREILEKFNLPTEIPSDMDRNKFLELTMHDKKHRAGRMNLALLKRIGKAFVHPIQNEELADFV